MSYVNYVSSSGLYPITEVVVGSGGQATIDFANIPQNFRSLRVAWSVRSTASATNDGLNVRCNGDTGANYYSAGHYSGGTSTSIGFNDDGNTTNGAWVGYVTGATSTANAFAGGALEIQCYSQTDRMKVGSAQSTLTEAPDFFDVEQSIEWTSTAAITELTFFLSSGNFAAGSMITLYGIAGPGQTPLVTPQSGALIPIAQVVVGTAQATITFPNIPQTYQDLRLLVAGQSTASAVYEDLHAILNGDSSANYHHQQQTTNGSTASAADSGGTVAYALLGHLSGQTAPAGAVGAVETLLPNYATPLFRKPFLSREMFEQSDASGGIYEIQIFGTWRSTAPITSIALSLISGNFAVGTVATLYGIAGVGWPNAPRGTSVQTVSANYTVQPTDDVVLVDASSGQVTVTLPYARSTNKQVVVKKKDSSANYVVIAPQSGDTIDGVGNQSLVTQGESMSLVSDQSLWYII